MLGNVMLQSAKIVVLNRRFNFADTALQDWMLMHLHVQVTPIVLIDLFILTRTDTKQRELLEGIPPLKLLAQKVVLEIEPKTNLVGILDRGLNL